MQFVGREVGSEGLKDAPAEQGAVDRPQWGSALTPATVMALQATAGNAAVARMLAREVAAPASSQGTAPGKIDETTLLSRDYPRELIVPKTDGENGRFDAAYFPKRGRLEITMAVEFTFVDGDPTDDYWISAVGGPQEAAKYGPEEFVWTLDEQAKWRANAIAKVQELWGRRYRFYTQHADWTQVPPVDVEVVIEPRTRGDRVLPPGAEGPPQHAPHHTLFIRKYPTKPNRRATFDGPNGELNLYEQSRDGSETPDVARLPITPERYPKYEAIAGTNPRQVNFSPSGSDKVPDADLDKLNAFGSALAGADAPAFEVTVTGHANRGTPEAKALSERRARNVATAITGAKAPPRAVGVGAQGADPTENFDFADITIGPYVARQSTVAHEFGHMFGLSDEYPDLTKQRHVGAKTGHSEKVKDMLPGYKPIVAKHTDDVMSVGETVRPHHYIGFLSALAQLTTTAPTEWGVGPAPPASMPD